MNRKVHFSHYFFLFKLHLTYNYSVFQNILLFHKLNLRTRESHGPSAPPFAWPWGNSSFNFKKHKSQPYFQQLSHKKTYLYEKLTLRRHTTSFTEVDLKKSLKKIRSAKTRRKSINLFRFLKTYLGSTLYKSAQARNYKVWI